MDLMDATHDKKRFLVSAQGWPAMTIWADNIEAAIEEYQLAVAYVRPGEAEGATLPRAVEMF